MVVLAEALPSVVLQAEAPEGALLGESRQSVAVPVGVLLVQAASPMAFHLEAACPLANRRVVIQSIHPAGATQAATQEPQAAAFHQAVEDLPVEEPLLPAAEAEVAATSAG